MIKVVLKVTVWFLLFMIGLTLSLHLVSVANTTLNVMGVIVLSLVVTISIKTKCLTTIKLRKHEK